MKAKRADRQVHILMILLPALFLAALAAVFFAANLLHYTRAMDADIAGDALFARELAGYFKGLPFHWAGSTERRILYAADLAALFYLPTGKVTLSMGLACCVMLVLLSFVMFLFYRRLGLRLPAVLTAILLSFALTANQHEAQQMFALYACYYSSQLIVLFIALYQYTGALKNGRIRFSRLALSAVLSFLMGLQGMRGFLMVYLPLLGTECLRLLVGFLQDHDKKKAEIRIFLWSLFLAALSYLTCHFSEPSSLSTTRNLRHGLEKLFTVVLPQIGSLMETPKGRWLWTLPLLLSLLGMVVLARKDFGRKKNEGSRSRLLPQVKVEPVTETDLSAETDHGKAGDSGEESDPERIRADVRFWPLLTLWLSLIVMMAAAAFTTQESTGRYFILLVFAVGGGFASLLDTALRSRQLKASAALLVLTLLCAAFTIVSSYGGLEANDESSQSDYARIAAWMVDKGYQNGISTFANAGPITVMADGQIQVSPVNSFETMEATRWLSSPGWYPPVKSADSETVYIAGESASKDLQTFMQTQGITPLIEDQVGPYTLYVLDKNYAHWP